MTAQQKTAGARRGAPRNNPKTLARACAFYVARGWDRWFDRDGRGAYIRALAALAKRRRS